MNSRREGASPGDGSRSLEWVGRLLAAAWAVGILVAFYHHHQFIALLQHVVGGR